MPKACPSPEQLAHLFQGLLDEKEAIEVGEHVDACSACEQQVVALGHQQPGGHRNPRDRPQDRPSNEWVQATLQRGREVIESGDSPPPRMEQDEQDIVLPSIPGYELLEEIGRGGMGIAYRARQLALNRIVTIKMILREATRGRRDELLERFGREAEAIARLRHENIVQIYEFGQCEGMPYMVLEFVSGGHLKDRLLGVPQTPREVAVFIEIVARAIHHAHEQGIVHRDVKPANILLDPKSGAQPGTAERDLAKLQPKIADFGLVKLVDGDAQLDVTATRSILGTPSYMAPEQVRGGDDISPATDIFAVGAILYEMLVGRPPFLAESPGNTLLQIVTDDPVPIRRLQRHCPRDLETICLKCLHKEPHRRYESAATLADDLHRFVVGEPIAARPIPPLERLWLQSKRQPQLATAVAISLVLLVAATGGLAWGYLASQDQIVESNLRAEAELRQANAERARADLEAAARRSEANLLGITRVALAESEWRTHDVAEARRLLDLCRPSPGEPDDRGWEWYYVDRLCRSEEAVLKHDDWVYSVDYSPDGQFLATVEGAPLGWSGDPGAAGKVTLWETGAYERIAVLHDSPDTTQAEVRFSHTGRWLLARDSRSKYRVWEVASKSLCAEGLADSVGFLAGDERLGVIYEGAFYHVDLLTAETTLVIPASVAAHVNSAICPAGKRVAISSPNKPDMFLYDAFTGELLSTGKAARGGTAAVAHASNAFAWGVNYCDGKNSRQISRGYSPRWTFSSDDHWLVGCDYDHVALASGATGQIVQRLYGHSGEVNHAAFSPDNRMVATAGTDNTVRLWKLNQAAPDAVPRSVGSPGNVLRGHNSGVLHLAFGPRGERLASASQDRTVRVWDVSRDPRGLGLPPFPGGGGEWSGPIVFSADATKLRTLRFGRSIVESNIAARTHASGDSLTIGGSGGLAMQGPEAAFAGGGEVLIGQSHLEPSVAKIWNTSTDEEVGTLKGHTLPIRLVTCSPGYCSMVATAAFRSWESESHYRGARFFADATGPDNECELIVWNLDDRARVVDIDAPPARCLALSQDGRLVAAAGFDNKLRVWETNSGENLFTAPRPGVAIVSLAFSPSGHLLAAGEYNGAISIWGSEGELRHTLALPASENTTCVTFSPDGKRLASVGPKGPVRLWDPATGRRVFTLHSFGESRRRDYGYFARVVFSRDGRRIAANDWNGGINIWEADVPPPGSTVAQVASPSEE